MHKSRISHPVVIYMYGLPGSGKSFVARQLSEDLGMAHLSSDRIRFELFEEPRHDKTENQLILGLMNFMTEQFLTAGVSVVYDISVSRLADRRTLRDLTRRFGAKELMVWIQVDPETAFNRSRNRDRRKADDRYASVMEQSTFEQYMRTMQNPQNEDYLVISGKHLFNSQKTAILRRLSDMGAITAESLEHKIAKPEMVNLVSRAQAQAGRVDYSRRNIIIR